MELTQNKCKRILYRKLMSSILNSVLIDVFNTFNAEFLKWNYPVNDLGVIRPSYCY